MNEIDVIDRNDPEYTALLDNVAMRLKPARARLLPLSTLLWWKHTGRSGSISLNLNSTVTRMRSTVQTR